MALIILLGLLFVVIGGNILGMFAVYGGLLVCMLALVIGCIRG